MNPLDGFQVNREEIRYIGQGLQRPECILADACGGTIAPWFSSVTFGGEDLKTVYIGSLRGTRVPYFRSPVAGLPMIHWSGGNSF